MSMITKVKFGFLALHFLPLQVQQLEELCRQQQSQIRGYAARVLELEVRSLRVAPVRRCCSCRGGLQRLDLDVCSLHNSMLRAGTLCQGPSPTNAVLFVLLLTPVPSAQNMQARLQETEGALSSTEAAAYSVAGEMAQLHQVGRGKGGRGMGWGKGIPAPSAGGQG